MVNATAAPSTLKITAPMMSSAFMVLSYVLHGVVAMVDSVTDFIALSTVTMQEIEPRVYPGVCGLHHLHQVHRAAPMHRCRFGQNARFLHQRVHLP